MAEMTDEEFARKLQEEENARAGGFDQARAAREQEDALLAQQLSREMSRQRNTGSYPPPNTDPRFASRPRGDRPMNPTRSQGNKFTIKSGQKTAVRLHNPLTKNHIGEVMYAHYITQTEVRFELSKSPGKSLRVNEHGGVEFSPCAEDDLTSHFKFELTIQGPMYLLCKAYIDNINIAGERSWFLAMTNQGGLQGNSNRGQHAQWVLVAATDPNANNNGTNVSAGTNNNRSFANRAPVDGGSALHRPDNYELVDGGDMEMNPLIPEEQRSPRLDQGSAQSHTSATLGTFNGTQSGGTSGDAVAGDISISSLSSSSSSSSSATATRSMAMPAPVDLNTLHLSPKDSSKEVQSKVWRWISSGYGQSFLDAKCPAGRALYKDNPTFLRSLIHRPDWPVFAARAKDWKGRHKPRYNADLAKSVLSRDKVEQFFTNGYTVLPGVCSSKMTRRVMKVLTYWLSTKDSTWKRNNGRVNLTGAVKTDPDLLALYYGSPLFHATHLLIGDGDVAPLDYGEISLIFPDMTLSGADADSDEDEDSDSDNDYDDCAGTDLLNIKVMKRKPRHGRNTTVAPTVASELADNGRAEEGEAKEKEKGAAEEGRFVGLSWIVDGFSKVDEVEGAFAHSPNTLLIAVALSDMPAPDPVQGGLSMLNVHEGSHITLMEAMKDQVRRKSTLFSEELRDAVTPGYPYSGVDGVPQQAEGKPDLGAPTPIMLHTGDAFLCTAKLAITYGLLNPSSGQTANSLAFFRVTHVDHEAGLREISMDNVWCEFPLAEQVLNPDGTSSSSSSSNNNNNSTSSGGFGVPSPSQQPLAKVTQDDHSELAAAFMEASSIGVTPAVADPALLLGQPIASPSGGDYGDQLASLGYPQPAPLDPPVANGGGLRLPFATATTTYPSGGGSGGAIAPPNPPTPTENPYGRGHLNQGDTEDEFAL